jgi:UDP-N-acetylmuramoylalanine--D-glutamate ligase
VAALTDFKGIKHRVEAVAVVDGVAYINDSKGTNIDATLKAIEAMKADTVLLLGGKNKGYDYGKLFSVLKNTRVIHAVLYGENRFALLNAAREYDYTAVTVCDGFDFAVRVAALKAKSGQNVLLSPASASFDEFANYEERGDAFVAIVQALAAKETEAVKTENIEELDGEECETADEE